MRSESRPVTATARVELWRGRIRRAKLLYRAITYALLAVLVPLFMGPFLFAFTTSFKSTHEIYVFPPRFFPEVWRWWNYVDAWTQAPFATFFTNTFTITFLAMIGQIASATLVAYGFTRFVFPGRDALFILVISTLIMPEEVTIIPTFLLFKALGWLDTWAPLIVPYYFGGGAFAIFLLRQFFLTLPRDMDEAAEIDGAGTLRILWSIIVPLSRPALATLAIFSFLARWNDFFHPLIYLSSTEKFTVSLGLRYYQSLTATAGAAMTGGPAREHLLMAAAFSATLPIVVIFFIFQRQFVRGIVLTGIKG